MLTQTFLDPCGPNEMCEAHPVQGSQFDPGLNED